MKFTDLGLSENLLKSLAKKKYLEPTEIQSKAIPLILEGRDIIGTAQTGTGKTAAFSLPLLEMLSHKKSVHNKNISTLILTPTRELAGQVLSFLKTYGNNTELQFTSAYGGVAIEAQIAELEKGVDILIATPGRLLDLYNRNAVKFINVQFLVLDEADRMLHMGFKEEINKIFSLLPPKRQNLFFSATFSDEIRELSNSILNNPEEISIDPELTTAPLIEQWIYPVDKSRKSLLLIDLLKKNDWKQVIIFSKTKNEANRITRRLEEKKFSVVTIHGNKSQSVRTRNLASFKKGRARILVATDVAARGLDIQQLPAVINYNLPQVSENYIHRIGRTGRADLSGLAISLVCQEEFNELTDIENLIQLHIPRKEIEGFLAEEKLKDSLPIKPRKKKRPKKKSKQVENES
jgi:ATP-dependent RNA helicase RhlE